MYALAKRAGLSAAISNPSVIRDELDPAAEDVLLARDRNCERWIAKNAGSTPPPPSNGAGSVDGRAAPLASSGSSVDGRAALGQAIRAGLREDAAAAAKAWLAAGAATMTIINEGIVPALEVVGKGFEKGTVFLPQLLMAADAAGEAFAVVKAAMAERGDAKNGAAKRPIVIATVKGDIHDIGKNIVRALLENYGFDVIDLGRDVPPEKIVETAKKTDAMLVGLSALMTTTVGAMTETIRQLKEAGVAAKTVVGGAVVTQEFADSIGADFYGGDAMQTVRIAEKMI
jgi:5-methyltetrahydrofolate--homocysteine methyltransferase